jgi:hypothetical protein
VQERENTNIGPATEELCGGIPLVAFNSERAGLNCGLRVAQLTVQGSKAVAIRGGGRWRAGEVCKPLDAGFPALYIRQQTKASADGCGDKGDARVRPCWTLGRLDFASSSEEGWGSLN